MPWASAFQSTDAGVVLALVAAPGVGPDADFVERPAVLESLGVAGRDVPQPVIAPAVAIAAPASTLRRGNASRDSLAAFIGSIAVHDTRTTLHQMTR